MPDLSIFSSTGVFGGKDFQASLTKHRFSKRIEEKLNCPKCRSSLKYVGKPESYYYLYYCPKCKDLWDVLPQEGVTNGILNWTYTPSTTSLGYHSGILSLIFFLILPLLTLSNSSDLVKLDTFYNTNNQNYQITIDKTASYLSVDEFKSQVIAGSIEKSNLAQTISTRISEWRDQVNDYNLAIASMQYFDQNIFTGILYPNRVQELKPLVLKQEVPHEVYA